MFFHITPNGLALIPKDTSFVITMISREVEKLKGKGSSSLVLQWVIAVDVLLLFTRV